MPAQSNTVELMGFYGGDLTHALSAWTSTSRDITPDKNARIEYLLLMLATDGHHTPFEKSSLHFLVTTDIATHIHLLKHRIGVSINGESARYRELKTDTYYVPTDWPEAEVNAYIEFLEDALRRYHSCLERLVASGMSRKRAKESARYYLPYGKQITSDVMFNFRSFAHFMNLRNKPDAQLEVRHLAQQMLDAVIATNAFPLTLKAFGYVN
jgi:flavin-dependent thymidylate synthase